MYSRAHLSRIVTPVVAPCSMAVAAGAGAWEFRAANTADHDLYAGHTTLAEPTVRVEVPMMLLVGWARLSDDEPDRLSAAPIKRIRRVE